MGFKLISGPSVEPVTLDEVKEQLSISDNVKDNVMERHIVAAREYCEHYTNSAFISQTWEIALDLFPSEIEIPIMPLQSIVSVKYFDTSGTEQTIDAEDYGIDNYSASHWCLPTAGAEWPATYDSANVVKVRYIAGYGDTSDDVPSKIKQAVLLTVGHWVNFQPQSELGVNVTMVPRAVDHLLNPYRVLRV